MTMQQSLRTIAGAVDTLLRQDSYPDRIRPDYLGAAVRDYPARGGKRLRPVLLTWCGCLLGAEQEKLLLPAAAVEVFHNWTLVHDDIIDQDPVRRGMPTAHVVLGREMERSFPGADAERFGRDFAILCGDLQQSWANDLLARAPFSPAVTVAALRRMQQLGGIALISGEAVDVELSLRDPLTVSEQEVIAMTRGKTGALLRLAAELGAM
ncbi:MAG: polyprenyl synthetase family protein, partial [Lentisphaeria bacterium]|nr:polyprenyl synthetase family protein [Lentisphaeria bacterium]